MAKAKTYLESITKTAVGKTGVAVASLGVVVITVWVIALGLKNIQPVSGISGNWSFETDGASNCGEVPFDGWKVPVWQEGDTFYGGARPEPMVKDGVISGKDLTFSIIILDEDSVDGYGDSSYLSGTIEGNIIRGTFSGGSSGGTCSWAGDFTVTIEY